MAIDLPTPAFRGADQLVLGATVRTLGAWPSGWRHPGAHRDPEHDPRVLLDLALEAERAGLDFLFFGDWLSTSPALQYTDPHLLAKLEPFSAISFLAAVTDRIGLIATVSSAYADPHTVARAAASADLLSGGRVGLSIASGVEAESARAGLATDADRFASAQEFVDILRGLWASWDEGAFVADLETGQLVDPRGLHRIAYEGRYHSFSGALNVPRSPQGQLPLAVAGSSPNARRFAVAEAELSLVSAQTLPEAIESYREVKEAVQAAGRDPRSFRVLTPLLPIVGATRAEAWALYDDLVALVPLTDATGRAQQLDLPPSRSIQALSGAIGVPLVGVLLDENVPARVAARFNDTGSYLLQVVRARSGRTVGGERPVTYRQLLVAHSVTAPVLVGSPVDIAEHMQAWYSARAVDGFTVLSAFLGEQFTAFTRLVVPELISRGLFSGEYSGSTLREHLAPSSSFAGA